MWLNPTFQGQLTIPGVVEQPLSVEDVVHRHDIIVLAGDTTPDSSQFLHVRSYTQQQTQVHTKRSDVGSRLARHPEDTEVPVVVVLDQL